jgi:hypothetical protein
MPFSSPSLRPLKKNARAAGILYPALSPMSYEANHSGLKWQGERAREIKGWGKSALEIRRTWLWQRSAGFEDRPPYGKRKNLEQHEKLLAGLQPEPKGREAA